MLSGNLVITTSLLHAGVGFLVPELREPFLRGLAGGFSDSLSMNERYAREAGFWFQMFSVLGLLQGFTMRSYCKATNRSCPSWMGWAFTGIGTGGAFFMPVSGFWLLIPQGLYMVWENAQQNKSESS